MSPGIVSSLSETGAQKLITLECRIVLLREGGKMLREVQGVHGYAVHELSPGRAPRGRIRPGYMHPARAGLDEATARSLSVQDRLAMLPA